MRRVVLALLLFGLLLPGMGWATPAHVQSANTDNTFDTTCIVSLTGTTAGNRLIVSIAGTFTADVITSVSDTHNTYTQTTKTINYGGVGIYHYSAPNIAGGDETVTVTVSSSKTINCALHEVSGTDTSTYDVADSAGSVGSTSTDADVSPSVTTTADGEYIFSSIVEVPGTPATFTAGTGYTRRQHGLAGGGYRHGTEDRVQSTNGVVQGLWTSSTTGSVVVAISTFRAQAASGENSWYRRRVGQ